MALRSGSQKGLRRAKMMTYNGQTLYIAQWAARAGLPPETVRNRLRHGYTLEEALRREPKYSQADKPRLFGGRRFEMDGIVDSIAGHCRRYGVPVVTVRHRRKFQGMSLEEAIRSPRCGHLGNPKYVTIGGDTRAICDWLRLAGISRSTYKSRISKGWTLEDALTKKLNKRPGKRRVKRRRRACNVHIKKIGSRRKCIRDWCREFGISESAVRRRLEKGWTFARAVTTPPLAPTERRGTDLVGIMSRAAGKKRSTVLGRLKRGWPLERALGAKVLGRSGLDNARARRVLVNGEEMTMTEACKRLGMSPSAARCRENMGWSLQDAVTLPKVEAKDRPGRRRAAMRRRELASIGVII